MLAIAAWSWIAAASLAVVALGILTKVSLGLLRRLKELNGTLKGASGQLNVILDEMRGDLDKVSEGLGRLQDRGDEAAR